MGVCFSALQRAEIAEIVVQQLRVRPAGGFSALQRAEIAESTAMPRATVGRRVSVLFNEPKLLKSGASCTTRPIPSFSALQRAEIAEKKLHAPA